ncbi:MAG: cyclic nucleotide-binding domain-containing protein [Rhodospirillaceae bacterium]|nr:cyclic nucleotide-binding domain-containing protein [Rhodospirillaceae bacterium]
MSRDNIIDRKTYPEGGIIFREGDTGTVAYIIQSGSVELFKGDENNKNVFATIGAGAIFGEMALIDKGKRAASAQAKEPAVLIVINETMFQNKLAKSDPFIRGLLGILVETVRKQN